MPDVLRPRAPLLVAHITRPACLGEPTDGARLHALRRRLGDTSCKQRGHVTAIVSRAVPWRISVRRADACNPAARSDRAIGGARRATCSQTSVGEPLQRPQARSPETACGATTRIVRVWTQNASRRCPRCLTPATTSRVESDRRARGGYAKTVAVGLGVSRDRAGQGVPQCRARISVRLDDRIKEFLFLGERT